MGGVVLVCEVGGVDLVFEVGVVDLVTKVEVGGVDLWYLVEEGGSAARCISNVNLYTNITRLKGYVDVNYKKAPLTARIQGFSVRGRGYKHPYFNPSSPGTNLPLTRESQGTGC